MSKTGVKIDNDLLEQVRDLLGTPSIRETVHCALCKVVRAEARRQEVAALEVMDGFDSTIAAVTGLEAERVAPRGSL